MNMAAGEASKASLSISLDVSLGFAIDRSEQAPGSKKGRPKGTSKPPRNHCIGRPVNVHCFFVQSLSRVSWQCLNSTALAIIGAPGPGRPYDGCKFKRAESRL